MISSVLMCLYHTCSTPNIVSANFITVILSRTTFKCESFYTFEAITCYFPLGKLFLRTYSTSSINNLTTRSRSVYNSCVRLLLDFIINVYAIHGPLLWKRCRNACTIPTNAPAKNPSLFSYVRTHCKLDHYLLMFEC